MIIKQFLETYCYCPFCSGPLQLKADVATFTVINDNHLRAKVFHYNDRLNIKISSNYFVVADKKDIDFSISIVDGNIIYCGMTSMFISLYDLSIRLYRQCKKHNDHKFSREISLYYDRAESIFDIVPICDAFSFYSTDNMLYSVRSEFTSSITSVLTSENEMPVHIPMIRLEKFPFNNINMLTKKMNAISLLT